MQCRCNPEVHSFIHSAPDEQLHCDKWEIHHWNIIQHISMTCIIITPKCYYQQFELLLSGCLVPGTEEEERRVCVWTWQEVWDLTQLLRCGAFQSYAAEKTNCFWFCICKKIRNTVKIVVTVMRVLQTFASWIKPRLSPDRRRVAAVVPVCRVGSGVGL